MTSAIVSPKPIQEDDISLDQIPIEIWAEFSTDREIRETIDRYRRCISSKDWRGLLRKCQVLQAELDRRRAARRAAEQERRIQRQLQMRRATAELLNAERAANGGAS